MSLNSSRLFPCKLIFSLVVMSGLVSPSRSVPVLGVCNEDVVKI